MTATIFKFSKIRVFLLNTVAALLICTISCQNNKINKMDSENYRKELEDSLKQMGGFLPPSTELVKANRIDNFLIISSDGLFLSEKEYTLQQLETELLKLKNDKIKETKSDKNIWIFYEQESGATNKQLTGVLILLKKLNIESKPDYAGEYYQEKMGKH
jgi:hypothetical protein